MTNQTLHFSDQGDGFPLFILHGLFGSGNNWNQIGRELIKSQRIIQVDLRNHGKSYHSPEMTYQAMANDIVNLMDSLQLEEINILGHSMGGKVAMEFALTYPDRCKSLIVVDIAPRVYQPRHDDVFDGLNAVDLSSIQNRKDAEEVLDKYITDKIVIQFLLKGLYRNESGFQWRFNVPVLESQYQHIVDAPASDSVFNKPVLFIKGMNSDYIDASDQPRINQLFPLATAKIIADTGHWPHADKPRLLINLIHKFQNY